jgi:hypothetical protein
MTFDDDVRSMGSDHHQMLSLLETARGSAALTSRTAAITMRRSVGSEARY